MAKQKEAKSRRPQTKGGYPAGDRLISELPPPPPGPAPGAKPAKPAKQNSGAGTQTK
jgi:hypothetical protein